MWPERTLQAELFQEAVRTLSLSLGSVRVVFQKGVVLFDELAVSRQVFVKGLDTNYELVCAAASLYSSARFSIDANAVMPWLARASMIVLALFVRSRRPVVRH